LLLRTSSGWQIANASGKDGKSLAIDGVKLRVEPALEWPQILRETWRIQRDYFYDPNLHGVDWPAMWTRYSAFLPHVRHREDLNVLIGEMIGELSCGHQYVSGGEAPDAPEGVSVGLLGCDFTIESGKYRVARIYRGQNWNPQLRSPLSEPGVDVKVGDYLLAVNGVPLAATQNLHRAFENTAGQQVDLTVSANADGSAPRTTKVVPIGSESSLRRMAWIEQNRKRVEELSGGRLAYLYMPDTGGQGEASFDRDFYSQLDKEGLILDERFNGGGKVADYVIDILSRQVRSYWMTREAWLGRTPFAMIDGPKVMIINERAGSGGDWMPWAFQRAKIGPLVGTRTWGGLVGISGYPPLMDGGSVTAASFGVMDENGEWAVENEGVSPDYPVVEYPKEINAGRDPQLEKAVELAMAELARREKKPLPTYKPPAKR
jgi:tricorn protease